MKKTQIVSIAFAIFSMFFGAGNLIYPLVVGRDSGPLTAYGMIGFAITAVLLPLTGLVSMTLFDGDYETFFKRLGKAPGNFLIFTSMLIIGPLIAIPRIVTLSHTMVAPFIPITFLQNINTHSSFVFGLIFLGITFLATFRENKIVDVLGKYIGPLLLLSLTIIIGKGILTATTTTTSIDSAFNLFKLNFIRGYETLDLLGGMFFASIVITILKKTFGKECTTQELAVICFKSGMIGVLLLGIVYTGMSILGAYHGHGFAHVHAGELFRILSFNILGSRGAIIIGTAVLMACLSTSIALSAVVAEYVEHTILQNKFSYVTTLIITLLACMPLSTFGLGTVLALTGGPIVYIGYPVLIALTFCNIAYKLFDFKPVKLPVLATFILALISYVW